MSSSGVIPNSPDRTYIQHLLPHQSAVLTAIFKYPHIDHIFLTAGYGCMEGDTIIETREGYKGKLRDYPTAYQKGVASIYSLTGTDGTHMGCTGNHRLCLPGSVVSDDNCARVVDLGLADARLSPSSLLRSIAGSDPATLHEDVLRYLRTHASLIYDYLIYSHLCDQLPLYEITIDRDITLQPCGAHAYNQHNGDRRPKGAWLQFDIEHRSWDGLGNVPARIHLCLVYALAADSCCLGPSLKDLFQVCSPHSPTVPTSPFATERTWRTELAAYWASIQPSERLRLWNNLLSKVAALLQSESYTCNHYADQNHIQPLSISYKTTGEYWDCEVPGHFYKAGGLYHHNSGKSFTDVCLILALCSWYQGEYLTFGIGGAQIKHLKETVIKDTLQAFDRAHMVYKHNSQEGTLVVGTITFVYFSLDRPETIFGHNLCLVGDTLITTLRGDIPIKDVTTQDQVLTREGWRRVLRSQYTGTLPTVTNIGLTGTEAHPIILYDQTKSLSDVSGEDIIYTTYRPGVVLWQIVRQLYSKVGSILDRYMKEIITPCTSIPQMNLGDFSTGTSGNITWAVFPLDTMYIILTKIQAIMKSVTWRLCRKLRITGCIIFLQTLKLCEKLLKNVTIQKKLVSSLPTTQDSRSRAPAPICVLFAVRNFMRLHMRIFALSVAKVVCLLKAAKDTIKHTTLLNASIAGMNIQPTTDNHSSAPLVAESGTQAKLRQVYDLTIEEIPEFFANGILTHNSGAIFDEAGEIAERTRVKASFVAVGERNRVALPVTAAVKTFCKQHSIPVPTEARSPFVISTTTAQGLDGVWLFMNYLKEVHIPYILIQARTKDNFHLAPKQLELLYKLYTPEEARVYLEGEYLNLSTGRVYAEFYPNRHIYTPFTIAPDEPLYVGLDFNAAWNASAVCVVRGGILYVIDEYHWDVVGDAPRRLRAIYPKNPITAIPDASGKELMRGWYEEFNKYSIETVWGNVNPSISERILVVNKLYRTDKLYVFPQCKDLINSMQLRGFDDSGKPKKDKGPGGLDHIADSLEYATWHIVHSITGFEQLLAVLHTSGRTHYDEIWR